MGVCDGCGAEVSDDELYRCGDCRKAYCKECAESDGIERNFETSLLV